MEYELEFAAGLMPVVRDELNERFSDRMVISGSHRDDSLQLSYQGKADDLTTLRTVNAVFHRLQYDIPRPKALLGHQHFHRLLDVIDSVLTAYPDTEFHSLHLNAAGSDSSVMRRIKQEIATATQLAIDDEQGDLLLRIRRTPAKKRGWDVLVRTTPRPVATRDWRVCNYPGALDSAVAQAMIRLAGIQAGDTLVNLACGSGSLLIEAAFAHDWASLIGIDYDAAVLDCARQNIAAASKMERISMFHADATQTPFLSTRIDCLIADLPFGQHVGSHDDNLTLYPAILREAGRIARIGARFVIITHEVRLLESVLMQSDLWVIRKQLKITLSGLHPRIFVLERL